jgi:sulfatase maturation enzyme AslB (radical SAM superfamily)
LSEIIKVNPDIEIDFETNGSHRSKTWWNETASILRKTDYVTFSIDGLPHNNHIYRKNSDWDSIKIGIDQLRLQNKARMIWKWIYFKYNQFDIKEGYRLSKDMGFYKFKIVQSDRHFDGDPLKPNRPIEEALLDVKS